MTIQISLKRLAEIKTAVIALRQSKLPTRVKRMRERLLKQEADYITLQEPQIPAPEGMCTRCRENKFLAEGSFKFCYPCIVNYLDDVPRWVIGGAVPQEFADRVMAELMDALLKNNLIGIPEVDDERSGRTPDNHAETTS